MPKPDKREPQEKKESQQQKRKEIDTAIGELLALLRQKASPTVLTEKVEAFHSSIQLLFPKPQKKE